MSLISKDCEVFARLINRRIVQALSKIIDQFQAGFIPNQFIGNQGPALKIILEDANKIGHRESVLLSKAYDYVN